MSEEKAIYLDAPKPLSSAQQIADMQELINCLYRTVQLLQAEVAALKSTVEQWQGGR